MLPRNRNLILRFTYKIHSTTGGWHDFLACRLHTNKLERFDRKTHSSRRILLDPIKFDISFFPLKISWSDWKEKIHWESFLILLLHHTFLRFGEEENLCCVSIIIKIEQFLQKPPVADRREREGGVRRLFKNLSQIPLASN